MHASACRIVLLSIAGAFCGIASAQGAWPERPIQLIVPFPAGGGVDVIARPFAEMMGERLHQPVVVVDRDGAAGTIGVGAVAPRRSRMATRWHSRRTVPLPCSPT
jgi:tripartite-type tricarboxylate transporter receptor subunit TctC